jgi:hypothetical protein
MDQRGVIRYYTLKGTAPLRIHAKLLAVYGTGALKRSTVFKWHKRFSEGRTDLEDDPRSGRPSHDEFAEGIGAMIDECPFISCKRLAIHFRIAKATCLRILHDVLHLKKFNLRWVPHSLSADQKAERVSVSREMLTILESEKCHDFDTILTGDESWFYFEYPYPAAWAEARDLVPTRTQQKIDTEKCLISVIWSVNGIHSLLDVPKGMTYNSTFFCQSVVIDLIRNLGAHSRRRTLKGLFVHLDNARPHNSRESCECLKDFRATRIPQPAYSPDLAPSDFFLFGYLKLKLQGRTVQSRQGLILAIREVMGEISREKLISVYANWQHRLRWVIENGGEYFPT